ncbi:Mitochondrial distribution and morphology protein 34 [Dissostichus eleginoides]|uniref:Mitochondrial distribution and morphology protein 34 n=1 Tax=Dissostichus eleginoides TaxID=100907 RepID=A0AAD9CRD9_DISEL|nr:Mitochondrial distribution and morphology protein 34 [Dissostichus eleginoides]
MATKTPDVTHIPFKIKAPHRIAVKNFKPSDGNQPRRTHIKKAKTQPAVDVSNSWSKSSLIAGRDQRLLLLKLDLPHLPPPPQMFLILQRENQQSLLLLLLPNKFLMIFPK